MNTTGIIILIASLFIALAAFGIILFFVLAFLNNKKVNVELAERIKERGTLQERVKRTTSEATYEDKMKIMELESRIKELEGKKK